MDKISLIFGFFFIKNVFAGYADYCEFDLCGKGLYCCGENKCCKSVEVWYYWSAVLLFVISVIVIIYFFIRQRRKQDYMYTEVTQAEET